MKKDLLLLLICGVLTVQAVCDPDRQAYPAGQVVQDVAPAREYCKIKK